jgi:hypothetical protein
VTLSRRTPLRRRSPLHARGRISPKRATPRRAAAVRDPAYLAFVRTLPCAAPVACRRPSQAHHAGLRGLGQRASDDTAVPLCAQHHADWHAAAGPFRGWDRAARAAWALTVIAETRALYARRF